MKILFTLIALGSFALVSADQTSPVDVSSNPEKNLTITIDQSQPSETVNSANEATSSYQVQQPYSQADEDNQDLNDTADMDQNNTVKKNGNDQDVTNKISAVLNSDQFSNGFQDVTFDVTDGNVVLKGSVDTLKNKNSIEESVKKIEGVKTVDNQVKLKNQ